MQTVLELVRRFERRRRFWRHVRVAGPQECWPWQGPPGGRRPDVRAYELAKGPLPPGGIPHHRCGDPHCVNPSHLEAPAP